ncbi:putative lipopolysaccharide biosynthesis O-acetyl transferase WbbJ [Sphingobacterium faecium NBRC 15299]|uniref:DapH/DapD/GlmU-related protein n=1 Tax=Sphingobacterium faecium TaxID=34087 RepID=UPI0004E601A2|nr:DapH/DapD/GlmU-related protein [Sphingobacterium faecium]PTX12460.1 lipopolysaccharide O-acetyltransferase [Sphingobacterium faecium]GEM62169.1 putative lipopolysaccharide biosynthesis O-acetyl transferase WbbJ [Sphingobacterium faecium NBRC 15299]CDT01398.1 putative acyl transferase [Sphingobacterium sp. PM2-P1-29]
MLRRYGILGSFRLVVSLIFTKLNYPKARLIRLPFDIRNKRLVSIGENFTTGFGCRLEAHPLKDKNNACLFFGSNVQINDYVHIAAGEQIVIGDNVLIASRVFISDLNHGSYSGDFQDSPLTLPNSRKLSTQPVHIEDNVWIGEGVCVLPGVTIGKGSIIGAMSVVTKSVPDYSIAVGVPAKVVKIYDFTQEKWLSV